MPEEVGADGNIALGCEAMADLAHDKIDTKNFLDHDNAGPASRIRERKKSAELATVVGGDPDCSCWHESGLPVRSRSSSRCVELALKLKHVLFVLKQPLFGIASGAARKSAEAAAGRHYSVTGDNQCYWVGAASAADRPCS